MSSYPVKEDHYAEGIKARDNAVINAVYLQFYPRISHFIIRSGGSEEDAGDIFQEAIIVIYRKLNTDSFELTCSFYTYLFSVCRNLWYKELQQKKKLRVTDWEESEYINIADDDEQLLQEERYRLYWKAFKQLGEDCQKVLTLFFAKQGMKEIARIMGYASEQYAKKRKFKCKTKLMELIEQDSAFKHLSEDG